jgi:hypothetical protein
MLPSWAVQCSRPKATASMDWGDRDRDQGHQAVAHHSPPPRPAAQGQRDVEAWPSRTRGTDANGSLTVARGSGTGTPLDPDAKVGDQGARGVNCDAGHQPVVVVGIVVVGALGLVVVGVMVDGTLGWGRLGSIDEVGLAPHLTMPSSWRSGLDCW